LSWSFRGLTATPLTGFPGYFFMQFGGYEPGAAYAITGTVSMPFDSPVAHTFELVDKDEKARLALAKNSLDPDSGFLVRAIGSDIKGKVTGFSVEVADYSEVRD
jgi:hypothetical protein